MYKIVMKPKSDNGLPDIDVLDDYTGKIALFFDVYQANDWIHRHINLYEKAVYDYVAVKVEE